MACGTPCMGLALRLRVLLAWAWRRGSRRSCADTLCVVQTQINEVRMDLQLQLAGLLAARRQLQEQLREGMPLYVGLRHSARQHTLVCQLVEQYRANLRDEHVLMLDFESTIYKNVRSPVWLAVLLHASADGGPLLS